MYRHTGKLPDAHAMVVAGPLINVTLSPHVAAGVVTATYRPTRLMVDTGAQKTVIEDRIAQEMGLVPLRFERIVGVSQEPQECPVYRMNIAIMMLDGSQGMRVDFTADIVGVSSPKNPSPHEGLLGRDFLQYVRLVYTGPQGEFEIQHLGPPPPGAQSTVRSKPPQNRHERKAARKAAKESRRKNRR